MSQQPPKDAVEYVILQATCRKCAHVWQPFGEEPQALPTHATIKCPACGVLSDEVWYDIAMQRELDMIKERSVIQHDASKDAVARITNVVEELKSKIAVLEHSVSISQKERELEAKKMELIEEKVAIALSTMNETKAWAKVREDDFRIIEQYAQEIEKDEQFRKDNK